MSLYIIFNPWRGYSLKIRYAIALILICLFAILAITEPVHAVENHRVDVDLGNGIHDVGNGVYVIYPSAGITTATQDELYIAQRIAMIIAERPDLEYVSLIPHAGGYGQTIGYIAIFRPKYTGNCTCSS